MDSSISKGMRPKTLAQFLHYMVLNYQPVMITGRPGIGKTEIVKQACEKADFDLIIAHPVVEDPTDYKGMPWIIEGEAKFLPFSNLKKLVEATNPTVFFLDDLGQATSAVQAASMQLILGREVNGHKISDSVTFVAATNRREDRAGVTGILEPVKSRFSIVNLEPTLDDWIDWALRQDTIPVPLISAVKMNPKWVTEWKADTKGGITNSPCPRNLAEVGTMMSFLPEDLWTSGFESRLGKAAAIELNTFLRTYSDLPSPKSIIANPQTAKVPEAPDALYAITGAMVEHANRASLKFIITYMNRLPQEYAALFFDYLKTKKPELQDTPEFIQWVSANKDIFITDSK